MGVHKLKNEKKIITFFLIVSLVVFGLSAYFLYQSRLSDELGGTFLTAMLLFISGYGIFVFIARAVRYRFISKLQKHINAESMVEIGVLAEKFGTSDERIEKETEFLINNGYLPNYEINAGFVVNLEEQEKARLLQTQELLEKQREIKTRPESEIQEQPKPEKKRRKTIQSEKCPNCGARVKFEDGEAECPYCGNSLKKA